jgi:hypothetical protein
MEVSASYSYGSAKDLVLEQPLANSPQHIGKLRVATPLAHGKLLLSESTQFLSPRDDQSGDRVRPVLLVDVTLTTSHVSRNFDVQFGIRNLTNWRYDNPTAVAIDRMRANGISLFTRVIWNTRE